MKPKYPWALVILGLVLFFPVGIYFLVKKMTTERGNYAQNGKGLKILAIVLFCLIPVYLIMAATGNLERNGGDSIVGPLTVLILMLGIGGGFALRKGDQFIRRDRIYNALLDSLAEGQSIALDPVVQDLNLPFKTVAADLQAMLDARLICSAYIDHLRRRLVVKGTGRATRLITCPHCGGKSEVETNAPAVCDYCDSPLD